MLLIVVFLSDMFDLHVSPRLQYAWPIHIISWIICTCSKFYLWRKKRTV